MSDHLLVFIPTRPDFVPAEAACTAAVGLAQANAPDAEDVHWEVERVITFHDCGENFERVRCPHCGSEISIGLWQDWMSEDWSESAGFRLIPKAAPCCQTSLTLNDLTYTWPQGFAMFRLTVLNPGKELPADTITRLQEVLGCELRVIRRTV